METPTITSATCCMESNRACSSFNPPPRNHCPTHHKSASTGLTPIAKARSSKSDLRCAVANHARFVKRQTPGTHAHGQRFCRPLHPARTLCLIVSTCYFSLIRLLRSTATITSQLGRTDSKTDVPHKRISAVPPPTLRGLPGRAGGFACHVDDFACHIDDLLSKDRRASLTKGSHPCASDRTKQLGCSLAGERAEAIHSSTLVTPSASASPAGTKSTSLSTAFINRSHAATPLTPPRYGTHSNTCSIKPPAPAVGEVAHHTAWV